ncbi:MAG TPA: hypothetical protein VHL53_07155 [Acidimicrobiia bacterium]|nr:hypothetical protein [Acidimicrobiia bacterium]
MAGWRWPGAAGNVEDRRCPPALRWAVLTQALSAAGDAFVTVSLAGSLFFSVSLDAARPRLLLYLLVSVAPFAVVAPLIGPFVDRVRGGHRIVVVASCAGRALLCLALARHLRTLLFYPEAFGVLVLGKTYAVARRALVPVLVDDPGELVAANSRFARQAAVAGAAGGAVAVGLLQATSAAVVVGAAAAVYAAAGGSALRVAPVPLHRGGRPAGGRLPSLSGPATRAMTMLRAGTGFLLFELAFELKRRGQPTWLFAVVAAGNGVGGLAGAWLAPRARRFLPEQAMLTGAVAASAFLALVAAAGFGAPAAVTAATGFGLAAGLGRQAFDAVLQRDLAAAVRGRAFARLEARFQLSWVLAGAVAVIIAVPAWAALGGLGLTLAAVGFQSGLHRTAGLAVWRNGSGPSPAEALVGQAEALLAAGAYRAATAAAALASEVATGPGTGRPGPPAAGRDQELVEALWRLAGRTEDTVPAGAARFAVDAARRAVRSGPAGGLDRRRDLPRLRLLAEGDAVGTGEV